MANTSQQEEPKANPYNQKKDWHKKDEKVFVSSNSLFFEEPETEETEADEKKARVTKAQPYKRPDYKKRYDDLKSHYDRKLNEFKSREQELIEEATKNRQDYKAPKTVEELEKFKKQYPDVYEVVETVSHMQSDERSKVLEERLSALQERETEISRKEAEKRLRSKHPDFDDLRNSENFHSWAKEQPKSIQDWIYSNTDDADLASRALDLFKKDLGIDTSSTKTEKPSSKRSRKSAADMVSTKTTAVEPKQQKIWTEREIAAMSIDEFDRFEDEIGQAITEGRVVKT